MHELHYQCMRYNIVFFLYLSMNKQVQKRDLQYLYYLLKLSGMYVVQPSNENEKEIQTLESPPTVKISFEDTENEMLHGP